MGHSTTHNAPYTLQSHDPTDFPEWIKFVVEQQETADFDI